MHVQEVKLEEGKRYLVVDDNGVPVLPVARYLKSLVDTGGSSNTQKTYAYALKNYFTYLEENSKDYREVKLRDLQEFVAWLNSPYGSNKTVALYPEKEKQRKRTAKTVNLTVTVVTSFYDYLYRNEELSRDMDEVLKRTIFTGGRKRYKDFLYHVTKGKPSQRNLLKVKEPRKQIVTLTKEQVEIVLEATTNIRDRLLIQLLFETGLRIGEVLSLFLEDFKFNHRGHTIRLTDRGELVNGAKLKTGEREVYVSQALMDLYDDYLYEVIDELDTDTGFAFVKLRGENRGKPMEYSDVEALFKRLRQKTGVHVHPHLFRHTHATMFYQETKDIKQVQERLGHSQVQTTMGLYVHPSHENIRKEWEKVQHVFQTQDKEGTT